MNERIKSCETCNELKELLEFHYCTFYESVLYDPKMGYCNNYVSKRVYEENGYNMLLRELKFLR